MEDEEYIIGTISSNRKNDKSSVRIDDTNMSLADLLKMQRNKKGISQREMCRELGIDNSGYAKFERGDNKRPGIMMIFKLARYLDIDPYLLMEKSGYSSDEINLYRNPRHKESDEEDDTDLSFTDDFADLLESFDWFILDLERAMEDELDKEEKKTLKDLYNKLKKDKKKYTLEEDNLIISRMNNKKNDSNDR